MNDITPKEASEILSHYTDLGYGIVIEGEDTSKIKQALSLASKTLANGTPIDKGDLVMFNLLMTTIADKGLPFEEVLLLIDNAKTPIDGDCISRKVVKGLISDKSIPIKFEEEKRGEWRRSSGVLLSDAYKAIDTAPPVPQVTVFAEDADEKAIEDMKAELQSVIESRPKGEWIIVDDCEQFIAKCSKCGRIEDSRMVKDYPFCHCGAEMKGGAE